jgi:hypothetical protein
MPARKVSLNSTPTKKPSLASLKPDKTSGLAARKRAVKNIEAAMTKKVTTTKVTKKVGENKVLLRRLGNKKSIQDKQAGPVLVLPRNMSIRAREKVFVIFESVTKDFEQSARQIAYISGLCFVLLGASMSLAFTTPFSSNTAQQATAVTATSPSTTPNTLFLAPTFKLLDPLPVEANSKTTHRLDITHARHVDVKLYSINTGELIGLQVDDVTNDRFEFSIDAPNLQSGEYVTKLSVESDIDGSKNTYTMGSFVVPSEVATADEESDSTATVTDTANAVLTASEEIPTTDITDVVEPEIVVPALKLQIPNTQLSGRLALRIESSVTVNSVSLEARQIKSIKNIPLGRAELRAGAWYYFFNTLDLPNGEYEIVALTRFEDEPLKSNSVKVRITNFTPEPEVRIYPTTLISESPIPTTQDSLEPIYDGEETADTNMASTSLRTFSEFSLAEVADFDSTSEYVTEDLEAEVDTVFLTYQDELRELLKRYAIAQQSGDPIMLGLSRDALSGAKERLVNDILNNQDVNHLADNIDEELVGRFETLQKRIDTFEELRRTASNNESSSDKDNDGISDYDESFLFGTNPETPDTDNDGVLDGIEIMGGFNPLDPSSEAIIEYEMPQKSLALIEDELLKVETIAPVIRNDLDENTPPVQAEIRGKGLPNSYVTIYIFSTPTVVTVRTDQDGSFVYTFEKELEDGAHEVYVAVTDNTGSIVAQSSPFKFIKQAQAFTPVNADGSEAVQETTVSNRESMGIYNVIVGLGILALGLILLMLGVGLRGREKMINPVLPNDFKAT